MNDQVVFDGRNLFEPEQMKELGFHYESVGREMISKTTPVATEYK